MTYDEYSFRRYALEQRRKYLAQVEEALKAAAMLCPADDADNDVYDAIEAAQSINWDRLSDVESEIAGLTNAFEAERDWEGIAIC